MHQASGDLQSSTAVEPFDSDDGPWLWGRRLLVLVVLAFVGSGLFQAAHDSPTVDEGVDLASGLSYWVHHDLRMSPEHPMLPKLAATLPALAADPVVPKGEAWRKGAWFDYTDVVLRANDRAGRLRRILFLSRLVPLLEAVVCGWLIFRLAQRLVGEAGALLVAGLWFTTPFILGVGHLQSLDVSFTLASLAVALALLRHRDRPGTGRSVTLGLTLALALLSRHTGIVLVPVVLALAATSTWPDRRGTLRTVGLVALVAYLGLWAGYRGFDPTPPGGAAGANLHGIVDQASTHSSVARLVTAVPAPIEWRAGFGYLELTSVARPSWLFGQQWDGSRIWFFPGSLLAKVPIGGLLVLLLGPFGWLLRPGRRRRDAFLTVAVPALSLFVITVAQPLNLGLRLVLPSVALLCVAAAPAAELLRRPVGQLAIGLAVISQVLAVTAAGVHSMAWSPPPFTPAYRWVSDSNVDFGQDMWRVRDWSRGRNAWISIVSPRGLERPPGTRDLAQADPSMVQGWVAVGVTSLTVVHRDRLGWLRAYCPIGSLGGGSVLLYRFAAPPTDTPGPVRPVEACDGSQFSQRR